MTHPSLTAVRPGDSSDEVKYAIRSQQAIIDKGKKKQDTQSNKVTDIKIKILEWSSQTLDLNLFEMLDITLNKPFMLETPPEWQKNPNAA